MAEYAFSNREAMVKQQVRSAYVQFFENNSPTYDALGKHTPKAGEITQKGVSVPLKTSRPGGFRAYPPDSSDFNEYFPQTSNRMYAFPLYAALGILTQGAAYRSFSRDTENSLQSESDWMADHVEAFVKRFNYMCHGDGTGRLAVSATTLASTGSGQTLTCTTTAAATPGQTKGGTRLELGHKYAAIVAATGATRGTFQVEATSGSAPTVNVLSGSITSGDDIVDIASYNNWFRGLPHLIDSTSRILQTRNTAVDRDLNDPVIDLNGATLTPVTFSSLKAMLSVRNNDGAGAINAITFMTPGQAHLLRVQQYGYRMYMDAKPEVRGVAQKYVEDGVEFILDADGEEDRGYLIKTGETMPLAWYEEKEFGPYEMGDAADWRMLFGSNNTGSDKWQKAIGWGGALVKIGTRCAAAFKRAALPTETQVALL